MTKTALSNRSEEVSNDIRSVSGKENEEKISPAHRVGSKRKMNFSQERISHSQPVVNNVKKEKTWLNDYKHQKALVLKHMKTIERQGKIIEKQKIKLEKLSKHTKILADIVNNI